MTPVVEPLDLVRFRELILTRTGMAFSDSRSPDLERAIRRATADAGLPTASTLYDLIARTPGVSVTFDGLVSALNVSETHFFRDQGQIEALRTSILPELIARQRKTRQLRIWSAGCSTGEEPYTIAILLRRLIPDLSDWEVLILATDINGMSLEHAQRAVYREWSFRSIPATRLGQDVLRRGNLFEVVPAIRRMVTFERLNLAEPVYPSMATNTSGMDLILCRNVLLYFDREQARAVIARLRSSLNEDGRLMVSRVDSSLPIFQGLRTDRPGSGVFTKAPTLDVRTEEPGREPVLQVLPRRNPAPSVAPGHPVSIDPVRKTSPITYEAVLSAWRTAGALEARALLDRGLGSAPLDAPLHYLEGLILLDGDDVAGALRAFRRSIYADEEFPLGHLGLGTAFARAGHRERALASLEKASRLVADLDLEETVFAPDGLTAAALLELVAGQRALLSPVARQEALDA